jgi:hypothetical protein
MVDFNDAPLSPRGLPDSFIRPGPVRAQLPQLPFFYYIVSHALWDDVSSQIKSDDNHHLQRVPLGTHVPNIATAAATWLSRVGKKMTLLTIIAHGVPGGSTLGEFVTSQNVAPLGGWISDHFANNAKGIRILGCNAAADSTQSIGSCAIGQASPLSSSPSHQGYDLLRVLAGAARQKVEAPLQALPVNDIWRGRQ